MNKGKDIEKNFFFISMKEMFVNVSKTEDKVYFNWKWFLGDYWEKNLRLR